MKNLFEQTNKISRLFLSVLLVSVMAVFISSCKEDEEPTPPATPKNIVEIASETPSLSILVDALTLYPDLVTLLSAPGTNTVFAPNNDAFVAFLGVIGQSGLEDIPESVLRSVLEYHVITSAAIASTDLSDGQMAETANGEDVTVAINDDGVFISNSEVISADIEASNGIVHIMKDVMVPPSILPIVGTIVAPAYFNVDFTTLIAAVLAADPSILELLLSQGPAGNGLTLFAPTNEAFIAAGITELPDQATLNAVLAYHVIDATIMAAGLPVTAAAAPEKIGAIGGDFFLSNRGGDAGVFINGSTQVTATDIEGSNGVVHVINRTLIPPSQTVVEIAVALSEADPAEFTTLVALLTDPAQAAVLEAISGDGPYTIFAPTDAAFAAISDVTDGLTDAQISAVLAYHVVAAQVYSTDLEDGLSPATLNPQTITINVGESVTISDSSNEDATVIDVNVNGTNGVIHVIDKVLIPTL